MRLVRAHRLLGKTHLFRAGGGPTIGGTMACGKSARSMLFVSQLVPGMTLDRRPGAWTDDTIRAGEDAMQQLTCEECQTFVAAYLLEHS